MDQESKSTVTVNSGLYVQLKDLTEDLMFSTEWVTFTFEQRTSKIVRDK